MPVRARHLAPAVLVLGLLLATIADARETGATIDSGPVRCPDAYAIVSGPPARELFDPYAPNAGHAIWCERYDQYGRPYREGSYRDFHPDGSPRTYAHFHLDRLSGPVLILQNDGKPWLHTAYRAGQLDGPYVVFTASGTPWIEARYERGRPVGRHITYFEEGGIAAVSQYRNGAENGTARAWYTSGQLRHEIEIVRGVRSGRYSTWHENGHVAARGYYAPCPPGAATNPCQAVGAARHGPWRSWHENGTQASQGEWRFGERVGQWLYWTTAGEPAATDVSRNGPSKAAPAPPPASPAGTFAPLDAPAAGSAGHMRPPID